MRRGVSPPDLDHDATTTRSFGPRRGLPNGRAVIGALLVTVAATGTFALAAADDTGPGNDYLVVIADIESGDAIELDDVALEPMQLPPRPPRTHCRPLGGSKVRPRSTAFLPVRYSMSATSTARRSSTASPFPVSTS